MGNLIFSKISSLRTVSLLLAVLAFLATYAGAIGGADEYGKSPDRQTVGRQVAADGLLVGIMQHKKGFYTAAESSLLIAKDYQDYLTEDEREKLDELLMQTRSIIADQRRISNEIEAVDKLIESGRFIQARAELENLKTGEEMTDDILNEIAKRLNRINAQLDTEQRQIAELYVQSLEYYRNNQPERAREGFDRIDKILSERALPSAKVDEQDALSFEQVQRQVSMPKSEQRVAEQPVAEEPESAGIVDIETDVLEAEKDSALEIVDRKIKVLRSYVKAIIEDAVAKSQNYAASDEFRKAKKTIASAEQLISGHRQYIGEEMFAHYSTLLTQQSSRIAQQESEAAW